MAKDFFQDIVPPSHAHHRTSAHSHAHDDETTPVHINTHSSGRSIRNITPSRTRTRSAESAGSERSIFSPPSRSPSRYVVWGIAAVCVLFLIALLVVAFRPTRITVTPRTHTLSFADETFMAEAPGSIAPLTYTLKTLEFEDSEVVPSDGVVYAEDKATGNLTVYNNFQTSPLTLVKNTRFAAASGLIFRTPADVVIPGKQGSTPGKVEITVVADQPGEQYNVAPGRFTVPGLKSSGAMYTQVYAESTTAFSGGFVGERPGVAAGALESAIATVRSRLQGKARDASSQFSETEVAFPSLSQLEFVSLPNTTEAGGGVRIHQKARLQIPMFDAGAFAAAVGAGAIDVTDAGNIRLIAGSTFGAHPVGTSTVLGSGPIRFRMSGSALLVWDVDEEGLQAALAGKDATAFEAIVSGFVAIQEAKARIEPFWKSTFPEDPADIKITVERPEMAE